MKLVYLFAPSTDLIPQMTRLAEEVLGEPVSAVHSEARGDATHFKVVAKGVDAFVFPWMWRPLSTSEKRAASAALTNSSIKIIQCSAGFEVPMPMEKEWLEEQIGKANLPEANRTSTPKDETILEEAQRLVHGNRNEDYGHPFEDFQRCGKMWAAILGVESVTPEQVSLCMVAVKISRECNHPKRDNRTDGAGYFETLDMCAAYRAQNS